MALSENGGTSTGRNWDDPDDIAVATTQEVIDGKLPVVFVSRDSGCVDGMGGWQFLDGAPTDDRPPTCVAKEELLRLDPTLAEVTDLPVGWYAEREIKGGPWKRAPFPNEEEPAAADFDTPLSPEADKFLAEACAEYEAKREALEEGEWRLTSCAGWDLDDVNAVVTVRFEDGSEWQADAQFLGSYSVADKSWQWAWDSPDIGEHLSKDSLIVRESGERFGLRYLVMGGGCFSIPGPDTVQYFCAIGMKATDSMGVMEAGAEDMAGFIMLKNLRWTRSGTSL